MIIRRFYGVDRIRNIGIIAHIDAGKTTTTERMLYYAGYSKRLGDVDKGNTVMDYLPEERERGITITSAAITFPWRHHQINLIDTPGHIDFSFEVERSLRVLDGAVAILDARAGVQAQTKTVWMQAHRFGIPRVVFINKLDKMGADYPAAVRDLEVKLGCQALSTQIPLIKDGKIAIYDLITQNLLTWDEHDGSSIAKTIDVDSFVEERKTLLEHLANLDDTFLEAYLECQDVKTDQIVNSIRRLTKERRIVPVLAGASFRNIGVQPLLDAVIDYLPCPAASEQNALSMFAFKCTYDAQKGPLVFVRVYSGTYQAKTPLNNTTLGVTERPSKLLQVYANHFEEVQELTPGSIGVLLGLKHTRTGDCLISPFTKEPKLTSLPNMVIPHSVFFCSVEPDSSADEPKLAFALDMLCKEDHSVHVRHDKDSGQTLLAGVGELHLDIVQKRIRRDFKVNASFGKVQISYRDQVTDALYGTAKLPECGAALSLSITPGDEGTVTIGGVEEPLKSSLREILQSCLMYSPLSGNPFIGTSLSLKVEGEVDPAQKDIMSSAVVNLFRRTLGQDSIARLEPIVSLQIECPSDAVGGIVNDLHSKRRGSVSLVQADPNNPSVRLVEATAPLSEILGYASHLRSVTQGHGSFSMEPRGYQRV